MIRMVLVGKHELVIADGVHEGELPARRAGDRNTSHRAYLDKHFGAAEISKAAAAHYLLMQRYRAVYGDAAPAIVEYFGGIGMTATIAAYELQWSKFTIYEVDPLLVEHLGTLPLGDGFDVRGSDAWAAIRAGEPGQADLVIYDPQLWYGADWKRIPDAAALLGVGHKTIAFCDVSPFMFHLPRNRAHYTAGISESSELTQYFRDLNTYLREQHGYTIAETVYWGSCAKHLAVKADVPHVLTRIQRDRVGYGGVPMTILEWGGDES